MKVVGGPAFVIAMEITDEKILIPFLGETVFLKRVTLTSTIHGVLSQEKFIGFRPDWTWEISSRVILSCEVFLHAWLCVTEAWNGS